MSSVAILKQSSKEEKMDLLPIEIEILDLVEKMYNYWFIEWVNSEMNSISFLRPQLS